jgi:putative endonuclease
VNHLEKGRYGEKIALDHLRSLGWRITEKNVRVGGGELDLVAFDGDELVVVEVRLRSVGHLLPPEDTVGPRKLRVLVRAGRTYVDRIGWEGPWRIDLLAVTLDGSREALVELFPDIAAGWPS